MLPHWPQWLRQRRLVVNAISTGIETDIFTPYIVRFATRWRKLVHYWFLLGALVGVTCFVLTLTYLLPSYILARIWPSGESSSVSVQVIIPGITIPWTYVPHVMIAIFMTLAFHELGHALSGANDNKAIESIGLVIQLFIPAAYVRFKEDHYDLSAWRQLKVYCAGSWHNFVLYGVSWLILTNSTFLYSPLFAPSVHGQIVTHIKFHEENTPLQVGDRIVGLNQCKIEKSEDWSNCISDMLLSANQTYYGAACVPVSWIQSGETYCCEEDYAGPIPCWKETKIGGLQFCKPARDVWHTDVEYCDNDPTVPMCHVSPEKNRCAVPSMQEKYREFGMELLQLRVQRDGDEIILLHVRQHPYELLNQLAFVLYEPRWQWMPQWTNHLADHFTTICGLLINFNLITPIVSLLPIYGFDGEYLLYALTIWLFPHLDDERRETFIDWVRKGVSAIGAILFLSTVATTLLS
jgi:S2P endopeptidase